MKKTLAIVIITALCSGFSGCGSQEKSQFNESTNQNVSFHGISFQIPKSWEKECKEEYLQYAERQSDNIFINCLAVYFDENMKISEKVDLITQSEKKIEQSDISVSNMDAIQVEYDRKLKGEPYHYKCILLQRKNDVISIVFISKSKAGLQDFEKVMNSISGETTKN